MANKRSRERGERIPSYLKDDGTGESKNTLCTFLLPRRSLASPRPRNTGSFTRTGT